MLAIKNVKKFLNRIFIQSIQCVSTPNSYRF